MQNIYCYRQNNQNKSQLHIHRIASAPAAELVWLTASNQYYVTLIKQLQLCGSVCLTTSILQVTVKVMMHLNQKEQIYEKFRTMATSLYGKKKIYSKIPKTYLFKGYALTEKALHSIF